ncbi:peptidylprolyl isomerase [Allochromatium vinosum]|uniref:peptidylprolyl isomerase n=1 Tax=Allochromatium vinosum (strain ATCC 17899 / DSM 180 / NBRC 103801 / NCIMB 10441 / D) TaxID=572477 RepID=D3RSW4_ALLVD|nr:peptidylprolyl isomerase [Allochromatium vinosum]ADC62273.1 PpiC-type peptidyl-prolyl cis-trans isomerase [Allochromatium vinosum DSM 180]
MKKTPLALLLCTLLATGGVVAEDKKDTDSPETLIATVNGTPYRLDVFRVFFMERLQGRPASNDPAVQQQLFDEFMNLIVASQEGDRRKLEGERNVVAALELERMKVMSNAALSAMADEIEPSEKELKDAYDRIKEQATRTEYKARHILLKSEDEAKKLIKQLDKGAKFEELAKKHSEGPTGKDGGDLGWFDPAQMVAPFAEAVTKLEPGSYTKEPVQTQFGWHIIELQETRKAEPPAFEDAKPQLTALVRRQKLAEMRNNAMVELNEEVVRLKAEGEDAKKD